MYAIDKRNQRESDQEYNYLKNNISKFSMDEKVHTIVRVELVWLGPEAGQRARFKRTYQTYSIDISTSTENGHESSFIGSQLMRPVLKDIVQTQARY